MNINDISVIQVQKKKNLASSTFESCTNESVDLNSTIKEELAKLPEYSQTKHKINFTPTQLDDTYVDQSTIFKEW